MKLTKLTHSCVILQEAGQNLVIDPGIWTEDLSAIGPIAGVVITHNHADHFDPKQIQSIVSAHPAVQIFSTPEVAEQSGVPVTVVQDGQTATVGPFTLQFSGEMHAPLHPILPPEPHNIGVLVNGTFYYGGDALIAPQQKNGLVLAAPATAPWLKMSEAIDFIMAVKPRICIPTHNALLSPQGQSIADNWLGAACKKVGAEYQSLQPGQSITF